MPRIGLVFYSFSNYWMSRVTDPTVTLCDRGLRQYFDIPPGCKYVELVLSEKPSKTAYRFDPPYRGSTYGGMYIQVRLSSGNWEIVEIPPCFGYWLRTHLSCGYMSVEIPQ